ncbi:DUF3460 family protein [Parachitinimonas caeni]|uniref:DUF3460 family protein n=1 Tax=Parachitinimonas caeni TaxID=3031301 RepID=A0ABT7E1D9_9NEIS|nr:DUF3460 family protein [Parachitinimonas caeni]MDK2126074.1 DUF3460 family protein [Parachitinimonas caeni]
MFKKDTAYVSEFTLFMRDFLEKNPQVAKDQIEGRARLWDKQIDRDFQSEAEASNVPRKPYYYQPD